MKIDFFFDFETRSHADLTEVDSINYALHPSTEATLLTWCFGRTGIVKAWRKGQHIHEDLIEVAMNPHKYNFIAHNIGFDYLIWTIPFKNKVIGCIENPKIENIEDNMALTCHYRVGASLGRAADILGMPYNKDKEGRKLMLKQCKPNPRTGQFIELDENEWEQFEIYGRTDTRLLRDIYYLCPALPAPERFAWEWTFRRNLRGIRVDTDLINEMDKIIKEEMPTLTAKFDRLVGGKVKLNSPTKTKEWFSQYYPWIENMQADTIREMMLDDRPEIPTFAKEALEIKDLAGSTSLAKVDTAKSIMYNGRIYNLLAYHYAQTKRWAGRGVQIQNFPRVDRKKPDKIDFDLNADDITTPLKIKRPSLQDPLGFIKNLLRRIWIPDHGLEFYCGDWSRIEPTVLFWLVGLGPIPDGWYEDMAATIYSIDVSTVKKDSDERQLGKSAALGCVAGWTRVFTERGLIAIEDILSEDLIWDGEKFVRHGGLSVNGMKSVMRIERLNIELTPDHLILSNQGWLTAVEMALSEDTKALYWDKLLEDGLLWETSSNVVSNVMSLSAAYAGLKRLFAWINSGEAEPELVLTARTLLGPEQIRNPMLAATWFLTQGLEKDGTLATIMQENGVKIPWTKIGHATAVEELRYDSNPFANFWNISLRWMGLTNGASRLTGLIMMDTMRPETFEWSANRLITKIVPVYDIKDCGNLNRYLTSSGLVHNCGYGMGHAKFRVDVFKKIGLRITENLAKQAVYAYRNKYPQITDLWTNLEYAMKAAAQYGTTTQLCNNKLHVMRMSCPKPGAVGVRIRLPSGGELFYHDVKIDHEGLTYLADDGGAVFRKKLYGGLLTEHVTSATARDILVPAIYRLEQAGFDILTLIHDEMWAQAVKGREAEFERLMCINPSWCTDMRIGASVDTGRRYLK